ncbi:MAG TPA: addiction module protein [Candidatus Kapabacteria bacterium]|nr:addiction module protein [Candidatus Kapabacteria bacterium]
MNYSFDNLTREVLSLPIEERAALAARIVESIENDEPIISSKWLEVAERRRQEIRNGTAKTMNASEVSKQVRRRIQ